MCIELRNYYWWIKCWRFCPIIANRQSLLLANILSYTLIMMLPLNPPGTNAMTELMSRKIISHHFVIHIIVFLPSSYIPI